MYPYSSSQSTFLPYPNQQGDNAQPGPSSYRPLSPQFDSRSSEMSTSGANPTYNPYLSQFQSGSADGSVQGESSTPTWRPEGRFPNDPSSSRGTSLMPWSTGHPGRMEGYHGSSQWDSPYSASMSLAGQNHERQGSMPYEGGYGGWRAETAAMAPGSRSNFMQGVDRRGYDIQGMEEGKRDILLLNQALTELIALLIPFRSSPSNPTPNPPAYILPRLANLAQTVHSTLHRLTPRFRLNMSSDQALPSPIRSKPRSSSHRAARRSSGRGETRDLTSPEREMEVIRKRRDALIARAKEGMRGGRKSGSEREVQRQGDDAGGGGGEGTRERDGAGERERDTRLHNTYPPGAESFLLPAPNPNPSDYLPLPQNDFLNIQQQHLHQLGLNTGVGNYDNRSSFLTEPTYHEGNDISRSYQNGGLIFGPPPDTIDTASVNASYQSAMSNFGFNPQSDLSPMSVNGQPMHFTMPPPPLPIPAPPFDYRSDLQPAQPQQQQQMGGGDGTGYVADFLRQRCHGCGVLVEGRWMQGPDGPDSLCVSCGSHYAKLNKRRVEEVDNVVDFASWGALPIISGSI